MTVSNITLKTLASFKGKDFFTKILGVKVYTDNGEYVGFIKRIILKKDDESVKRVFIKNTDGRLLSIDPSRIIIENNRVILIKFGSPKKSLAYNELALIVKEFKNLAEELEHIRYSILILDEKYFRGYISQGYYERERNKLEKKRAEILTIIRRKVEYIEKNKRYIFDLQDSELLLRLKEFLERIEIEIYGEISLENFITVLTLS
ncbi:MAG: PRC-barrel domain-containing protein [Thermoproteales archaeon]|nr:PRC-barrel domain-containing protein [Thermoproteales archaeon]